MRVLMISHIYPSRMDSVYGSFVHSQVKALQEQGCAVQVMAPTALAPFPLYVLKDKWRRFHETPRQDNYQGVDVVYPRIIRTPGAALFELSGLNYYYALKGLVLERHQERPYDLIHAQVAYPDGWAAARLAEELNLPLVLTLHGQELQKIVNWSAKLKRLVQDTLAQAAAVVVPSVKMQALARQHGVEDARLHLVYNGLDPLPPADLPRDIKEKIRGAQVLLSVGRLEREKGFQYNIQALHILREKHPELVYLLVGDGAYRRNLEEEVKSLDLADRVIFVGYQPREKVGAFYANSHVFSMPSKDESFGIVYLEAMAAGLPVIATEGEGIAPLLEENAVGRLVTHGDAADLAGKISELLDPEVAGKLGQKGQEVAAAFTWERSARNLLDVYKAVVQVRA